jgi:PAS domain S-box-containing protein
VGLSRDITECKEAELELAQSEQRFRLAAQATRDVIWDWDVGANKFHHSEAMRTVFGHDPAKVSASLAAWSDLIHPDDRIGLDEKIGALLAGKAEEFAGDYRFRHADGDYRYVRDRAHVLRGPNGKATRIVGAMQDVTSEHDAEAARTEAARQQAEAERLSDLSAFKTQFLNNAAHELATPMTPLKLQIATLESDALGPLTPRQRDALGLLQRNVNRMGTLVNDLLDAARLQGGRLRIVLGPTALSAVVGDALASFMERAREAGITLSNDVRADVVVQCDATRMAQVLTNLVHNALKFTPSGGQVHVGIARDAESALVTVRDTGIGLTAEQRARLFQPFAQVHDAARHPVGGTGLGLYISRGIVEQHGGQVTVESDGPGHGSSFVVRLPLKALPAVSASRPSPRTA